MKEKIEKCPIHYKGQDYWARVECPSCQSYLNQTPPKNEFVGILTGIAKLAHDYANKGKSPH